MQQADIALLEVDIEQRISHIEAEYVDQALHEAEQHGLTQEDLHQRYHSALLRIGKRLGGVRLQTLQKPNPSIYWTSQPRRGSTTYSAILRPNVRLPAQQKTTTHSYSRRC